jgi:pyroglutamyl-peptidase
MKFLLTGFEPFGGSVINPSEQVVQALAHEQWTNIILSTLILPVDRYRAPEMILGAMENMHPDVIICLGEAGKRAAISLEKVAINLLNYRIADNNGNTAQDLSVAEDGPAAYFSTLPLRTLQQALLEANIPVEISLSAGTYLCNQIMYSVLHQLARHAVPIPAGFIHLPLLPEQASLLIPPQPSMSLDNLRSAMRILLRPEHYLITH